MEASGTLGGMGDENMDPEIVSLSTVLVSIIACGLR
jgi:hypothetical protein